MMLIVDEITDPVAEKARLAMEGLIDQMRTQDEWNQCLFAVLLVAGKLLRDAYGDAAWRVVLERLLARLDDDPDRPESIMH